MTKEGSEELEKAFEYLLKDWRTREEEKTRWAVVTANEFSDEEFIFESNAIEGYSKDQYGVGTSIYQGHMNAWNFLREQLVNKKKPLTKTELLETHRLLLEEFDPNMAGVFRSFNVRVGNYICPCWEKVPTLIGMVYEMAAKAKTIVDCWNVHHAFESVHPFGDGNGRTGRCVLNALLMKCGHKPVVVLCNERRCYYMKIEIWRKANQHLFDAIV